MARKRFRSAQRNEPVTDRSFQEYLYQTAAPLTTPIVRVCVSRSADRYPRPRSTVRSMARRPFEFKVAMWRSLFRISIYAQLHVHMAL